MSKGDDSPDQYCERFPRSEGADSGQTVNAPFERSAKEREAAAGTVENWQYFFGKMEEHFKNRSAASITPDEARRWIAGLISPSRQAHTVNNTWLNASHTVFGWAAKHKHIPRNPFADVNVTLRGSRPSYARHRRSIPKNNV